MQDPRDAERWLARANTPRSHGIHSGGGLWPGRYAYLLVLSIAFLALALGISPQVGTFLRVEGGDLAENTMQTVSAWLGHGADSQSSPRATSATPLPPTTPHQYWQVGLIAGTEDAHVTGMRTTIETRVPQRISPKTTNYYWVGAYLSDGSFIQVGYYIPWYESTQAGWFYCAFYSDERKGPCKYGPLGSAGKNGVEHVYTLEAVSSPSTGKVAWRAEMDSAVVGQFDWSVGDTGQHAPVIYAESSGFQPHPGTSQLGPVDFASGIEVRHAGQSAYTQAAHAYVTYSAANVCPPYGIALDGHGGELLGSGLPCPRQATPLW